MDVVRAGKVLAIAGAAVVSLGLTACDFGPAVTFTVTTTADAVDADPGDGVCEVTLGANDCSLRAAVMESNATPEPTQNTIVLGSGQTYELTLSGVDDVAAVGDLDITRSVHIVGGGSLVTGMSQTGLPHRAFENHAGTFQIDHARITGDPGFAAYPDDVEPGAGGALLNHATAVLADVELGGSADGGGVVIHQDVGTTILVRARITGSTPNILSGGWAAVMITGGQLLVADSEISDNLLTNYHQAPDWAGVYIGPGGYARVLRSTIVGHDQGAIVVPAPPYVHRVSGSGIESNGTVDVIQSTIVDNGPDLAGTGTFHVSGSIVGLDAAAGDEHGACTGTVISQGHNVDTDGNCVGTGNATDLHTTDPVLGPLGLNGGSTATQVPLAGSVAVDSIPLGTPGLCDGTLTTDQRGLPRPVGTGCDRGAVERQATDT